MPIAEITRAETAGRARLLRVDSYDVTLAGNMGQERSVSVLQTLHSQAQQAIALVGDPQWVTTGQAELAAAGATLLRAAEPGSDQQLAWAELLSWSASTPDQLDLVAGLLDGGGALPGLTVDAELRWTLLRRLAPGLTRVLTERRDIVARAVRSRALPAN